MPDTRRSFLYLIFLALLLVVGFVFRSFLIENIAGPVALIFWFIMRLFAAVDQRIYWFLLIVIGFLLAVRNIPQATGAYDSSYPEIVSRSALENVKNWRAFITLTTSASEMDQHNLLRQNLIDLLVTMYAAGQEDGAAAYTVYESLKRREIPLPEPVYRFLLLEAPVRKKTLFGLLQRIRYAPRQWIRRIRGQDVAEYYQSIDFVLAFMETSLEMPHDNQHAEDRNP